MKSSKWLLGVILSLDLSLSALCLNACNSADGSFSEPPPPGEINRPTNEEILQPLLGNNVLQMTVNGDQCSQNSYINKPCVSVTLCSLADPSRCQTISDILVDTGSYGLRVFKSIVAPDLLSELTPLMQGDQTIAECVNYGDGSSHWGSVHHANVVLGNEPPVQVSIQLIDSTFRDPSTFCPEPDQDPEGAGFNGILGVGVFNYDCGPLCATQPNNRTYYACNDSKCASTTVPLSDQIQNPVAVLPNDNNGVILKLPSIPLGGTPSANGYLILGIGTQQNNTPTQVASYALDPKTGDFFTFWNNHQYTSFLDSGSNGIYFSSPIPDSLTECSQINPSISGWFCPPSLMGFYATTQAISGSPSFIIPFQIGNLIELAQSSNQVFTEIAGSTAGNLFDWGLPFFLGRNVYFGIEGKKSPLGEGPYWAY